MKKMLQKSAVMRGTDNMVIKEIPVPEIKDKEVLVSLEYVGICGSDVHYFTMETVVHIKWICLRISCWDMNAQVLLWKLEKM